MYLIIELHSPQVSSIKNYLRLVGPLGGLHPFKKQYHFGSIIIEPNDKQVYIIENLHYNNHFQLDEHELISYKNDLAKIGFVEADSSVVRRPAKYYITIKSSQDYHLPEITVLNIKENIPLHNEINYSQMSEKLFSIPNKAKFDRNTYRFDIGFSSQNQTDGACIKGMNIAAFGVSLDDIRGINGDYNMSLSLIKHGCILNGMLDEICQTKTINLYFNDSERNFYFSDRISRRISRNEEFSSFRAEGMSIAITGRIDDALYKLENHVDSNNDFRPGYNVNFCYSEIVPLPSKRRDESRKVRVMTNLYGKKCCGDALERYKRYMKIMRCIRVYKEAYPQSWMISTDIISFENRVEYKFLPPNVNKDVYYSIFIHEILYWAEHIHYNYYTVLEMVYTMVLTPSPSAWRENIKFAMNSDSPCNFFISYVKETLKRKSSVSEGSGIRKQVSCGAGITHFQVFSSLKNMDELIRKTNSSANKTTDTIIQWWTEPIKRGGLQLVGPLWAQELLNILAKLDIIKDKRFYNEGFVASSTNTSKKLKAEGIRNKKDRLKLLQFVTGHVEYDGKPSTKLIAESAVCESLRFMDLKQQNFGNSYFAWPYVDTVHRNQNLYYTSNFELYVLRKNGCISRLHMRHWEQNEIFSGVKWWIEGNITAEYKKKQLDFSVKSTSKRQKINQLFIPTLYSPLRRRK